LTKVGTIVKIREYRDKGLTKKATAQRLGLDRKTVAKYWEGPIDDLEKPRYEERSKLTDPYVDYITNRLDEWPELTAERIYREIKSQGYPVSPTWDAPRGDIVQAVMLSGPEELSSFCHSIQAASPVDSFVQPVPGDMPGYEDPVIMAGGTFIQGSSIELSADGPMRSPYIVYLQGGLCKEHVELALYQVVESLLSRCEARA
jgi:transcriptional regulator with XRE-family HTH domain